MNSRHKVILYFYNRLFDPVIQSNFWLYVQTFLSDPDNAYDFHLVTYEDSRFPLEPEQQQMVEEWRARGLQWTQLQWHPGTGFGQKLRDVVSGFRAVMRLRFKGYRYIVSLNSVAGAFAYLYARVLGMKLYMYQYEPHSEYAIDNGMWAESSLQYRITNILERRSAFFARVISSGTCFMEERLRNWGIPGRFFRIPSVANSEKFHCDLEVRARMRKDLGLEDSWVLLYPGKFGGLYYREEFASMYRELTELEPRLHLLIVTPHTDDEVHVLMDSEGVDRNRYTIAHSDYSGIQDYYYASDFGIISVPPGPSKQFISNIKVGEYLCAGLPYLVVRGVSEDYVYAEEQDVGVVVDNFDVETIRSAWPEIEDYLTREPEEIRSHCRSVGLDYRGFDSLLPRVRGALAHLVSAD